MSQTKARAYLANAANAMLTSPSLSDYKMHVCLDRSYIVSLLAYRLSDMKVFFGTILVLPASLTGEMCNLGTAYHIFRVTLYIVYSLFILFAMNHTYDAVVV